MPNPPPAPTAPVKTNAQIKIDLETIGYTNVEYIDYQEGTCFWRMKDLFGNTITRKITSVLSEVG